MALLGSAPAAGPRSAPPRSAPAAAAERPGLGRRAMGEWSGAALGRGRRAEGPAASGGRAPGGGEVLSFETSPEGSGCLSLPLSLSLPPKFPVSFLALPAPVSCDTAPKAVPGALAGWRRPCGGGATERVHGHRGAAGPAPHRCDRGAPGAARAQPGTAHRPVLQRRASPGPAPCGTRRTFCPNEL